MSLLDTDDDVGAEGDGELRGIPEKPKVAGRAKRAKTGR
jgi:hypothetical protein